MAIIKLKRGNRSNLPASVNPGEPVVCQDTGEMFFGDQTGNLVQINAFESEVTGSLYNADKSVEYNADDILQKSRTINNAQTILSGGGNFTLSGNYELKWDYRMIVICAGHGSQFASDGYFSIDMPPVGTYINRINNSPVQVNSNGILLGTWEALYYRLPVGGHQNTDNSRFFIYNYQNAYMIPDDAVLIALRTADQNCVNLWTGVKLIAGGPSITSNVDNSTTKLLGISTANSQQQISNTSGYFNIDSMSLIINPPYTCDVAFTFECNTWNNLAQGYAAVFSLHDGADNNQSPYFHMVGQPVANIRMPATVRWIIQDVPGGVNSTWNVTWHVYGGIQYISYRCFTAENLGRS